MKIIEVVPIAKGISKEKLSYFTAQDIPLGALVEVPVRSRTLTALVIGERQASELKSEIKTASYTFKKVGKMKFAEFFLPEFTKAAEKTAEYFGSTTGAALHSLVPKAVLELAQSKHIKEIHPHGDKKNHHFERMVLQRADEERVDLYKSLIREEFAKQSSVFIVMPTIEEALRMRELLKKGIEQYTFVLHNNEKPAELTKKLLAVLKEKHSILIIGTGSFLSVPRADIETYIVEKEASRYYKQMSRPFIDFRVAAEKVAEARKKRVILADSLLRTETIWRVKNNDLLELEPLGFKVFDSASPSIVDMKQYKDSLKPFRVLSEELIDSTNEAVKRGGRAFFFGARRGLAPGIICADCGLSVTCNNCHSGVILHQSGKPGIPNYFLCHHCGEKRPAEERCKNCDSWRLSPLGIGTELIEEETRLAFPNACVLRLDRDNAPTEKKAEAIIKKYYETRGAILIGTELALPYLTESISVTAVISLDSFFSIPDFRMNEKIMSILLKLRTVAASSCLIQSRNTENKVLEYAVKGNLLDFYKDEILLRRSFSYPPFFTLIKVSFDGKKPSLIKEIERMHQLLEGYDFTVFPALVRNQHGSHSANLLIKVPSSTWPDPLLLSKLLSLPPSFTIKVDPDTIL